MILEQYESELMRLISKKKRHRRTALDDAAAFSDMLSDPQDMTADQIAFIEHRREMKRDDIGLLTDIITQCEKCLELIAADNREGASIVAYEIRYLITKWQDG